MVTVNQRSQSPDYYIIQPLDVVDRVEGDETAAMKVWAAGYSEQTAAGRQTSYPRFFLFISTPNTEYIFLTINRPR